MSEQPKKEDDEFFEGEDYDERPEPQNDRDERHEEWLKERRKWLRSLSQQDRDFIAKYGEKSWRDWKERDWKIGREEKGV